MLRRWRLKEKYRAIKSPAFQGNAVHLSGAALRSTGNRVFDIFTVLGLEGLGRCRRDPLYGDVLDEGAQEPAYATATGR